ncbi:hypothetical protein M2152_000517 [Microbacteriaceae bacterium SG_E_30_P1]|uniref:DUF4307 domain-containing protein n=1 Tax=Antiquaquibacter oligotrophicus TaxID=2880260 RepID=A0ABT6KK50_9MICO|nr:DUF4307 domain-containing protein [Antiquaquibacter oligotrophicus]MDH6180335.1 hypothetical protein [Antiquaquibacter oligotrophicus]UDF13920.1 DUF4307 domain-containing protein [Antiquaquibacter oligotrophicus]
MTSPDTLSSRYGRTPGTARRTRTIGIIAAVAVAIVFGLWLWWGGLLEAPAQFEAKDTGHTIESDSRVSVRWQFTAEPGTPASCAIQALDSTFGIVGWRVVDLPPSDQNTRVFTESVLTTERAVTGLIYRCWLT